VFGNINIPPLPLSCLRTHGNDIERQMPDISCLANVVFKVEVVGLHPFQSVERKETQTIDVLPPK
jgi:hypothetical protein